MSEREIEEAEAALPGSSKYLNMWSVCPWEGGGEREREKGEAESGAATWSLARPTVADRVFEPSFGFRTDSPASAQVREPARGAAGCRGQPQRAGRRQRAAAAALGAKGGGRRPTPAGEFGPAGRERSAAGPHSDDGGVRAAERRRSQSAQRAVSVAIQGDRGPLSRILIRQSSLGCV